MIGRFMLLQVAAVLSSCALFACSGAPESGETEGTTAEETIINGAPATDPRYAAVGALVLVLPGAEVGESFCTGTLVGPRAIVTARHCTRTIDLAFETGLIPAFALGADAFNPTQIVAITDYRAAPAGEHGGLLLDGGRDVAVAHLASQPAGVRPVRLGQFENNMLGTRFQIVGYGVRNAQHYYGDKFAGLATARAVKGRWYELLFKGNYKAYRQWYFADSSSTNPSEAEARAWWDTYTLEPNYELLAGGLAGDAVACNGDSGGPLLLGTSASTLTTYGVSFAVEQTISTACGLGGGYLVFNAKMLQFVKNAI